MKESPTRYFALGGLCEVGKNMYILEKNGDIIIIDSGTIFPSELSLGVDYIMADISYLKRNEKNIKALFITHGHEDHIGGIPYLVTHLEVPVIYAAKQAKELIESKLKDENINYDRIKLFDNKTKVKLKNFEVEFFRVNHSIPDAHGIAITTSDGTIITTGDFKFDLTPIGPKADYSKITRLADKGVDLLLSDSTNALSKGFSMSEAVVDNNLNEVFEKYRNRRIIIATFASNIYRLKHIVETCYKYNKKVFVFGRSMERSIEISGKTGYIDHSEIFCKTNELNKYEAKDIVILCTGTQGEPLAALSRIASGTHKQIKLLPDDVIIFSSSKIPGNANAINRTINKLFLQGVKVITVEEANVHTSGHAYDDELKLMISLANPKYFAPLHGEYRMLKRHKKLAQMVGVPEENIFILGNGEVLELNKHRIERKGKVETGDIYIDGAKMSDINSSLLKDRKTMSSDGIIVLIANISMKDKKVLAKPNVTTRGFVVINENPEIITNIENIVSKSIKEAFKSPKLSYSFLKNKMITDTYSYVSETIGRHPIITPIILNIN